MKIFLSFPGAITLCYYSIKKKKTVVLPDPALVKPEDFLKLERF